MRLPHWLPAFILAHKRSVWSCKTVSPSPFHPAITGLNEPVWSYGLSLWRQPTTLHIGHELGCSNSHSGQMATALTWNWASPACKMPVARGGPCIIAPPTRVQVISVASALPQDQERPVTRWTRNEIVATLLDALTHRGPSAAQVSGGIPARTSISSLTRVRIGSIATMKTFEAKAHHLCNLYAKALESYQQGRLVICWR